MVDTTAHQTTSMEPDTAERSSRSVQGFKQALELLSGPTDERRFLAFSLENLSAGELVQPETHALGVEVAVSTLRAFCRFVGLLLAVNTMPRDDLKAIHQVHETAGPAFFDRLLLPLHRDQVLPISAVHCCYIARAKECAKM